MSRSRKASSSLKICSRKKPAPDIGRVAQFSWAEAEITSGRDFARILGR